MSGILDNRTRIMDTIVTLEGRRQMADGKLKIEYVSFTDATSFYDPSVVSGSADATTRLYFEQCHLPQDQITFEADDSGRLKPFKNNKDINLSSGKIASYKFKDEYSGSARETVSYLTGSQFASAATDLLASSIDNFKNLYVLGTRDFIFEDEGFGTGVSNIDFKVTDNSPIKDQEFHSRLINDLPSLFDDKVFSKSINFRYLPPINKLDNPLVDKSDLTVIENNKIGDYSRFGEYDEYTNIELEDDLKELEEIGYKKTVVFNPTSLNNKLVTQVFEINDSDMKKLDVVEYGPYRYGDVTKNVYFVGKVFIDENGTQTFVRIFTLVFE